MVVCNFFCVSEKAAELYTKYVNDGKTYSTSTIEFSVSRCDPILIRVFHEIGTENFSGKYARVKAGYIYKKYENYYDITDYDGKESVYINYEKMNADLNKKILDNVREILRANLTNDEKVGLISEKVCQSTEIDL